MEKFLRGLFSWVRRSTDLLMVRRIRATYKSLKKCRTKLLRLDSKPTMELRLLENRLILQQLMLAAVPTTRLRILETHLTMLPTILDKTYTHQLKTSETLLTIMAKLL